MEDSFQSLASLSPAQIKGRIQVEFTDEHGIEEAGLDGGGLFKEFLNTLLKTAFDPAYNLFAETGQNHFIYPNPNALELPIGAGETMNLDENPSPSTAAVSSSSSSSSSSASLSVVGSDDFERADHSNLILKYFYFLGQMIAKAVYEGIQIETQFALFFLRFCLGLNNYIDDLQGLDSVIYHSLMKVKSMTSNEEIESLGLTFSVDRHVFGVTKSFDLVRDGSNLPVNGENKVRFLYLMADYYLNRQQAAQSQAFAAGMASILDTAWLNMFTAEEFRLLISGSQSIDRAEFAAATQYSSGYTKDHELIRWFWQIVKEEFNEEQVQLLLKFTTSCSRAPLLGFKQLNPQFCIQVRTNQHTNTHTHTYCDTYTQYNNTLMVRIRTRGCV